MTPPFPRFLHTATPNVDQTTHSRAMCTYEIISFKYRYTQLHTVVFIDHEPIIVNLNSRSSYRYGRQLP